MRGKTSTDGHIGPCSVALKWMPYEISIVSVPADATVGVGRDLRHEFTHSRTHSLSFYEKQIQLNNNYFGGK